MKITQEHANDLLDLFAIAGENRVTVRELGSFYINKYIPNHSLTEEELKEYVHNWYNK